MRGYLLSSDNWWYSWPMWCITVAVERRRCLPGSVLVKDHVVATWEPVEEEDQQQRQTQDELYIDEEDHWHSAKYLSHLYHQHHPSTPTLLYHVYMICFSPLSINWSQLQTIRADTCTCVMLHVIKWAESRIKSQISLMLINRDAGKHTNKNLCCCAETYICIVWWCISSVQPLFRVWFEKKKKRGRNKSREQDSICVSCHQEKWCCHQEVPLGLTHNSQWPAAQ